MTEARLLGNAAIAGGWRLLRVETETAEALLPGHWLEFAGARLPVLTTAPGAATLLASPQRAALARLQLFRRYPLSDPLGEPWPEPGAEPPVLIGVGESLAGLLFFAERHLPAVVLLQADPPPFRPAPSQFVVAGAPAHAIAAAPMLEAEGIPSRIASPAGMPGCFEGDVVELYEAIAAQYAKAPVYAGAPASVLARLAAPGLVGHAPP